MARICDISHTFVWVKASAGILCGFVVKQLFLCLRYLRRAWLRQFRGFKSFHSSQRLPRQVVKDLQALSAYQLPADTLKTQGKSASVPPGGAASLKEDVITYSVPRKEIVHQLNRALEVETLAEQNCSIDGNSSSYRYRFPHRANVSIDPADMAYLAECHGHYKEAESLYHQSIRIRAETLGPQHLDVAIVTSDLASLYCAQKRYAEAEPLLTQALCIQQQAAPDQLETGNSLYQLARLYQHQERYSAADPLFQEALTIFRQQLGAQHPKTQAVYADLMKMVVTAIEVGKFTELNAGMPPLDLNSLSDRYSWAKPQWK